MMMSYTNDYTEREDRDDSPMEALVDDPEQFDNEIGEESTDENSAASDDDDDQSTQYGQSKVTTTGNDHTSDTGTTTYRGFTPEETKAVHRLRLLMIVTLFGVAMILSILVWYFLKETEQSEFEDSFQAKGTKLVSGFRGDAFQKMQALDSLSTSLTNYAAVANLTWPLVTIQNSHEFLSPYLNLANAASLRIQPVVAARERAAWEAHTEMHQEWVERDWQTRIAEESTNGAQRHRLTEEIPPEDLVVSPYIKNYVGVDTSPSQWIPWWQYAPAIENRWFVNFNQLADAQFRRDTKAVLQQGKAVISSTETFVPGLDFQSLKDFTFMEQLLQAGGYGQYEPGEPIGYIHYPVFESLEVDDKKVVAIITVVVYWKTYFENILSEETNGIVCVVENDKQVFTYLISGGNAEFQGMQDLHDSSYDKYKIEAEYKSFQTNTQEFTARQYSGVPVENSNVVGGYRIRVYPSQTLQDEHVTADRWIYAAAAMALMILAISVFMLYDCHVERRQNKVSHAAEKSDAIITSLFPVKVREQLFNRQDDQEEQDKARRKMRKKNPLMPSPTNSKAVPEGFTSRPLSTVNEDGDDIMKNPMLGVGDDVDDAELNPHADSAPIADFFPSCTVIFMDIAGFTSWSSSREPPQVFVLLEALYSAFDIIAQKRKIFKVETIGDCYVAVCGLPDPCDTHALNSAKFARECMEKMQSLVHRLEPKLGPDTGDLMLRAGMHSGPVTAGVLRGDRARFQLFGDTVNTASRMESTGVAGKIQVSRETAELLASHSKGHWTQKREDPVKAKGKGELTTFWLHSRGRKAASKRSGQSTTDHSESAASLSLSDGLSEHGQGLRGADTSSPLENPKIQRLIDYSADLLVDTLKKIEAKRHTNSSKTVGVVSSVMARKVEQLEREMAGKGPCVNEVAEFVELPEFNKPNTPIRRKAKGAELSPEVIAQARSFCETIARSYRRNPFHSFEHACHVVQSSAKLLSRILAAQEIGSDLEAHDSTFGITSDPMTHFALIFSALIHDVDHRGVPNGQLANEEVDLASYYQNQAIAEQNSFDIAWTMLMEPEYVDLRRAIYQTDLEIKRFRELVVNCLMATDVFDADLKSMRENRWERAFHTSTQPDGERQEQPMVNEKPQVSLNRKATIVIEHVIQASDVSHTMQHWYVYLKWNDRLYFELYKAYHQGRSSQDPTPGWYQGELNFFDFYIIPLAKKLKECGVFGVSSDEYLNYALENRREWEKKGKEIVAANREKIQAALDGSQSISNTEMPIRETPMKKSQEWNAARQQTQAIVPEEDGLDESFRSETLAL
eukprot:CAMPEP_0172451200 /NCGR_PEP_ID=MMETSP1065-20121228/9326_1 /TAXON_ID=265537 /ORGANISM="Amphiprora paludosa, Strain CCMP125" /LENGTH=1301 /DNA_ID=CAMNT_0013203121 /DNA_START=227 /DNA_END=4132 /DNA_ORIENTATION=+